MSTVLEHILRSRLVAIVRLDHYENALDIARALLAGGVTEIEFTLTGKGANQAITEVRSALGEQVRIGVGSVLEARAAEEAIAAGAQFVVTPVVVPDVIVACKAAGVPILCGALTPTEALNAYRAGADFIKIFPARVGGPQYIKDILAPLPQLRVVPTGGVSPENARTFLDAGAVAVAMGGNLVSAKAVAAGDWDYITAQARAAVEAVR